MIRITPLRTAVVFALGLAACSGERPTATSRPSPLLGLAGGSVSLIECPGAASASTTSLIGPLGGVLAVGGTRVVIPANAVLAPTTFTLSVPASKYVELDVTTSTSAHYVFAAPVVVTLDYGRCSRNDLDRAQLSAWNIDPESKTLLERMPSVDDKLTRTITFTTLHFSGYAVAD